MFVFINAQMGRTKTVTNATIVWDVGWDDEGPANRGNRIRQASAN